MRIQSKRKAAKPAINKRQLPPWINRRNVLIAAVSLSAVVLLMLLLRDDPPPPATTTAVARVSPPPTTQGEGGGAATETAGVANRPPSITSLQLSPDPIYPGMVIKADPTASDPEGDIVVFAYEWKKNGDVMSGQITRELATSELHKGDLVTVTVVPTDSQGNSGEARTSRQLLIHNRPPEIVSTPPAGSSTGQFSYQVKAQDPDDDALSYAIEEGPPGMTINAQSGLIEWNAPPGLTGKQQVRVTVTDRDAKAFQAFNLNLSAR